MNTQNIRNNPCGEVRKLKYSKSFSGRFSWTLFLSQERQNLVYFFTIFFYVLIYQQTTKTIFRFPC